MEAATPDLLWTKIKRAAQLLGLNLNSFLAKTGISPSLAKAIRSSNRLLPLERLDKLANKSGLPIEFFISKYEPKISSVRFRIGSPSLEAETEEDQFYLRREILRLGTLTSLLVRSRTQRDVTTLVDFIRQKTTSPQKLASLILAHLRIRHQLEPIGPQLVRSLESFGITLLFYPIFTKAKVIGLSWWETGALPIIVVATRVAMRRAYFTIAHELFHLIRHLPSTDSTQGYTCKPTPSIDSSNDHTEETDANTFAACILMPDDLKSQAKALLSSLSLDDVVSNLSNDWDVSRQAVAIRLVEWGLVQSHRIGRFFPKGKGFARPDHRPPQERFGSPQLTHSMLNALHDAGSSARYLSWATKLPLDMVLQELGRLNAKEAIGYR